MIVNIPRITDTWTMPYFVQYIRAQALRVGSAWVKPTLRTCKEFWFLAQNGFAGPVKVSEWEQVDIDVDPTQELRRAFAAGVRAGDPGIDEDKVSDLVLAWLQGERQRIFDQHIKVQVEG